MRFLEIGILVTLVVSGGSMAVSPETWDHKTEADFTKGEFDATVVSSLGEVSLSRRIEILTPPEVTLPVVTAVVRMGKDVYAASGVEGIVYRIGKKKIEKFAELPGAMVASLIVLDGELLAGTGGEEGAGIYRVDRKGEVTKVFSDDKVKYVWAILGGGKDTLFAATGPEGKVFTVTLDDPPTAEVLYEAGKLSKNILCITRSPETGLLYAGTDEEGLVVEIDPRKKTSRIVLDADEKEIAALVTDDNGGLYAATSDAAKARADGKTKPNAVKAGKGVPPAPASKPAPEPDDAPQEPRAPESQAPADLEDYVYAELEDMHPQDAQVTTPDQADLYRLERLFMDLLGASGDEYAENEPAPDTEDVESRPEEPSGGESPTAEAPEEPGEEAPPSPAPPRVRPPTVAPRPGTGNAVYYIRPDGLVETRFRRPVTILGMLLRGDTLYLGTGNGGAIYSVSTDGDRIAKLADTDAAQVTSMTFDDGEILFATANDGAVGVLSGDLETEGTFTSEALDAKQIARWGTLRVSTRVDGGTKLTVATRSGNVAEPDASTWSSWSKEQSPSDGFLTIGSPGARFLQYRLSLTGDGKASPTAQRVTIIYQVGNLAPVITGVTVAPSAKSDKSPRSGTATKAFRVISIAATDPNSDKLTYTILFRDIGAKNWIRIAEDLTKPKYTWDTRTVADGKYEILVRASDSSGNAPDNARTAERISDPVIVDNTPPLIRDLGVKTEQGKVVVNGSVIDAGSRIVSIHYSVDSQDEWTVVSAGDGIFDSDSESFSFVLKDLSTGAHRIAVKGSDLYDNVAYASIAVTVGGD